MLVVLATSAGAVSKPVLSLSVPALRPAHSLHKAGTQPWAAGWQEASSDMRTQKEVTAAYVQIMVVSSTRTINKLLNLTITCLL